MKTAMILFAAALATATPAHAWNDKGHMTVAAAAWSQMTPQARREAARLLKLNPKYGEWVRGVPETEQGRIAFLRAATWPDKIRGEYEDDGYDPVEPRASQNIGYADRFVHRYWHFKDIPFSPDGTSFPQPDAINAVSRITLFTQAIGSPATNDDVRSFDLSWLLHLVGDIHQPLHASERYTSSFRRGDAGGNNVKVCATRASYCSDDNALHSFWDGAIGNSKSTGVAIAKAERLPPADPAKTAIDDPDEWARESFKLARAYAYAPPVGPRKGPYTLDESYERNAGSIAEQRIALAGARLARLLNKLWT